MHRDSRRSILESPWGDGIFQTKVAARRPMTY